MLLHTRPSCSLWLSCHYLLRQNNGTEKLESKDQSYGERLTETPDKKKKQGVGEHARPHTSLSIMLLSVQASRAEEGVIWLW